MNEILGKISSYNLFNYLFSGVLFVILSSRFTSYDLIQADAVTGVFLYYFIGLVVSRIGSLVMEPVLRYLNFVKFEPYNDFVTASKADPSLETLSEVNNMYRTIASACVAVVVLKLYDITSLQVQWLSDSRTYILLISLFLMFLFAYRKQTKYIAKRIRENLKEE